MLITDGIPSSEDDVFQEHNQPHKVPVMVMVTMRMMRMIVMLLVVMMTVTIRIMRMVMLVLIMMMFFPGCQGVHLFGWTGGLPS